MTEIAFQLWSSRQSTRLNAAVPGWAVPHRANSARPSGFLSASKMSWSILATFLSPLTAMTSQRYHAAPASDCSIVGVNHTGRSSERRSCSSVAPTYAASWAGHRFATCLRTVSESTASRCPLVTRSSWPTAKVWVVCPLSQGAGLSSLVGATASSYDSR